MFFLVSFLPGKHANHSPGGGVGNAWPGWPSAVAPTRRSLARAPRWREKTPVVEVARSEKKNVAWPKKIKQKEFDGCKRSLAQKTEAERHTELDGCERGGLPLSSRLSSVQKLKYRIAGIPQSHSQCD